MSPQRWREELSQLKRPPPALSARPVETPPSELEGTAALGPRRDAEEFNELLDFDFILSNSLMHQEPAAAAIVVAPAATPAPTASPCPAGPFAYPLPRPEPAGLLYGGGGCDGAPAAGSAAPFNLADITDVSPSGGFVAELMRPDLDAVYLPAPAALPPLGSLQGKFVVKAMGDYNHPGLSPKSGPAAPPPGADGPGAPYTSLPRMCPKIKQEAAPPCTLAPPPPHGSSPRGAPQHDFALGSRPLPARSTPSLGPEEMLGGRDCLPATPGLGHPPLPPGYPPAPGYPTFLPEQLSPGALQYQGESPLCCWGCGLSRLGRWPCSLLPVRP